MKLRSDSREEQARAALLAKRRRLAHVAAALLLLALLLILVMGAIQTLEATAAPPSDITSVHTVEPVPRWPSGGCRHRGSCLGGGST